MKLVLNKCYGGFSLSKKAIEMLESSGMTGLIVDEGRDIRRTDPKLIECVEKLGREAGGENAYPVALELPEITTDFRIEEYDGFERVYFVVGGKIHKL